MDGNSSDREGEKPPEGGGGSGGGGNSEPKVRRKMKTAAQLQVLERTYQVETYPSESLRAELSAQLGLSDRQLQMWFCHRRLKDRKTTTNNNSTPSSSSSKRARKGEASPATVTPPAPPPSTSAALAADDLGGGGEFANEHGSGSGSGSSPYGHVEHRRAVVPRTGVAVPRISHPRYYEPPSQSMAEVRAISFVEAQLGAPLREDGPALGIEFDPLPPGAFGAPIDAIPSGAQQKQAGRAYDRNLYERPDVKATKGHGRALHEYQFLPEQPTVRVDAYERLGQPHYYGSPSDGPSSRTPVRSYLHNGEEVPSYGLQGQIPSLNLMPHHGKHSHHMPSTSEEFDGVGRKTPYMPMESPFSSHPTDTGLMPPERHSTHEEDVVRLERKRKTDESRIQKEVEAHEKRIRKELEKQDMLRRKREEQMRKEMERHDRERKKEEERMLREKQREEERYQREQRREMERREKFLLKESLRAEKLKQKEELRREKEAARQKAANDRAVARKLAKESTELIEDERLELMEIAASRKGLQSILSLDSETLQNLDSFRDMLSQFPPKTVQLKKPFAVQPWTDSEENVGNLLMLWRFFITFADVFGLWPFTLDEFVQAFHDYDPRLLGEIHIALLRSIIKDIEDVARTPSGLAANQSNAANPGGGHPQLVEGAYAWGFDIQSWQRHLSPLTWPEILRQLALSAGFGPKLKKNVEQSYLRDDNEGNDGMSIISNLRNGAAAENAVAIMQERGYSNPRRSRHRLTPGTVKFAAFHVLSLEGDEGLNILEVADRIQKSGLRDLTTSKTPEASIAAALSRDTKLFERVAPSTYCVRTPYRKDPADAAAILAAAREKIRVFKSGFVDGVEADDPEKDDDSESDIAEDPEVDDPGAELATGKGVELSHEVKIADTDACMANGVEAFCDGVLEGSQNGLGNAGDGLPLVRPEKLPQLNDASASIDQAVDHGAQNEVFNTTDQEDNDIDEGSPCEPWVQGLIEGDYSDLSVEERLNALVALIGIAIEGNSVRVVLDERLEAANALKKQMWAEAQLDKRRLKEENMTRSQYATSAGSRMETNVTAGMGDNRQSPSIAQEGKCHDASPNYAGDQEQLPDAEQDQKPDADAPLEKSTMNLDSAAGPDNPSLQQSMYAAAERSRAQLKSYIGHKAEELYVYRSLPLGMDRRRNRYWQFIASASCNDPGSGRIFVELHNGGWRLIETEEAFNALIASLDVRGIRESHLHALLQRVETLFKESVKRKRLTANACKTKVDSGKAEGSEVASHPDSSEDSPNSTISASNPDVPETSSSFQIECGRNSIELKSILKRYKDFEEWMWKECFMSSILHASKYGSKRCTQLLGICDCCHDLFFFEDRHCSSCHNTYTADMNTNFSDHVARCEEMLKFNPRWKRKGLDSLAPLRIRLLKAQLAFVEVSLPTEALKPSWSDEYRRLWCTQFLSSSSADDLLQALTALEGAIKKDYLSPNFQSTNDLLSSSSKMKLDSSLTFNLRDVSVLPWIPQTTAAVALRLRELDSAVSYTPQQREEFKKEAEIGAFMNIQSKFTMARNVHGNEASGPNGENFQEDNWLDPSSGAFGLGSSSRGGRGRGVRRSARGGSRSQRRLPGGSRLEASRRNVASTSDKPGPAVGGWKSRSTRARGGGKKRSRRTTKSKPKPAKKAGPRTVPAGNNSRGPLIFDTPPPGVRIREEDEEDWNEEEEEEEEAVQMQVEARDEDDSNSEYEYEDNMVEDDNVYVGGYGGSKTSAAGMMMEGGSDEDEEECDEEEEEEDMDVRDMRGEFQRVDYSGLDGVEEEYEQDVEVEGYLNAESEDEGNEDEANGNPNLEQDEASASPSSSSEYSD